MSNLINEFFSLDQPCPEKVPNCVNLREQYLTELQTARSASCQHCDETKIKVKYMEIVWNAFIDSLNF